MRLILEPSKLKLYISPVGSRNEPDYRACEALCVDGTGSSDRNNCDRSIDANLPAVSAFEASKRGRVSV